MLIRPCPSRREGTDGLFSDLLVGSRDEPNMARPAGSGSSRGRPSAPRLRLAPAVLVPTLIHL